MKENLHVYGCKGNLCAGVDITGNRLVTSFLFGTVAGAILVYLLTKE